MPYVDNGQKSHQIGHCKTCQFQWVIAPKTKGKRGNKNHTYNGQVCAFCGRATVWYSREDNR